MGTTASKQQLLNAANQHTEALVRQALGVVGGAGLLGAGVSGAQWLGSALSDRTRGDVQPLRRRTAIPIYLPAPSAEEDPQARPLKRAAAALAGAHRKRANETYQPGVLRKVLDRLGATSPHGEPDARHWLAKGTQAFTGLAPASAETGITSRPFLGALYGAGVPAAFYFGRKGVQALQRSSERRQLNDELSDARRRYRDALTGQPEKTAAAPSALDRLAEKRGSAQSKLLTAIAALSGFSGAMGTYAGYQYGKGTSDRAAYEEALERRRRQLYAQAPFDLVAVPVQAKPPKGLPATKAADMGSAARSTVSRLQQQKAQWMQALQGMSPGGAAKGQPAKPQAAAPAAPAGPPSVRPAPGR